MTRALVVVGEREPLEACARAVATRLRSPHIKMYLSQMYACTMMVGSQTFRAYLSATPACLLAALLLRAQSSALRVNLLPHLILIVHLVHSDAGD